MRNAHPSVQIASFLWLTFRGRVSGLRFTLFSKIMYFMATEPQRGGADGKSDMKEEITLEKTYLLLQLPTNIIVFVQAAFGCLPWGIIFAYVNDYLAQDSGLGVINASISLTVFGIACALGGIWGAILGQHYQNAYRYKIGLFTGLSTLAGIPPTMFLVLANGRVFPTWTFFFCSFTGGFLSSVTGPNVSAVVLNVNSPETRGTAFAIFNLFNDVGKGLGPFIGAFLIRSKSKILTSDHLHTSPSLQTRLFVVSLH